MKIKVIKIMISMFLIFIFNMLDIKVQAINNDSFYNGEYLSDVYIKKTKGYSSRYETGRFIRRTSDGHFSYCLQPFTEFIDGKVNTAYTSDYEIITNMTKEKWERVLLLAYYGYGYNNHTDKKWYIITQMMIWKTVDSSDIYFTDTLNGNRISKYESELQELETLVSKHYIKPSFDGLIKDISLNETITIADTNQVLNRYTVLESNGISASISGNEVLIKGTSVGQAKLILENKDKKYSSPPIVYVDSINQDLMVVGSYETIKSEINFNVLAGKIKIIKVDSETNSNKPSGEALLEGSKYQIINSENQVIETITIDLNGNAVTSYLPLGNYTIREVTPSKGYYLDATTYNFEVKEDKIYEINLKGNVIKSNIEITRIDSETKSCKSHGEATLKGAMYGIYDYQNNLVDEIIIDDTCKGLSKKLPYGKYKVKEINSSTGYKIDNNIYEITIEKDSTYYVKSIGEVIKSNIEITRIDSETKSCKPLGEATLKGAVYGIYDYQNNLVDEVIIDDTCKGLSESLYYGKYKIKELKSSLGYKLNNEIKEILVDDNKKYEITIENEVIKNKIEIYKFIGNEDTGFLYLESDAVFNVINKHDEIIQTVITDSNGYTEFNLPYGNYKIKQISGNEYYKLMYPFSANVTETSSLVQKNYLKNGIISAKLKLTLMDSESKLPILVDGVKFKIKNKLTDEYICQTTNITICEFETNENGIMIIPLELIGGTYIIEEIEELNGYILSNEKIEVEISNENIKEDEIYGSIVEIKFNKEQVKGSLKINKKGETKSNNYIPLKDVEFKLYAAEDIVTKDGITHYLKDQLIDTLSTLENGIVAINNLYLGKYYFIENYTNDNYILDNDKYEFEITSKNNNKNYEIINYLKRGNLEIKTIDEESEISISEIEIGIYDEFDNLIKKDKTNNIGKIQINNLLYGKYYVKVLNKKDGYILNDEKIYFEIVNNNEIVELNIKNQKKIVEEVYEEEIIFKEQIEKEELIKEPVIIEVPNTLSNNFILDNPELIMMVILMYFYGKKKC